MLLEQLLWDADTRYTRAFAVTSSPGDAHTQNGPELIVKLNPTTQSAALLPQSISNMLWELTRKPLCTITTQRCSS